tara:strand:- start:61 stop:609 length:549 start_codon:yes stop_codon:yes gene_type:complete
MTDKLNQELALSSLQLVALSEMSPDDRIARIVWERIQDDLEMKDSLSYGIQYCIANIAALIANYFRKNSHTSAALDCCYTLITTLGWELDTVLSMEQAKKVFIDYIKDVVVNYDDIKQSHCENAQCLLAMNMNFMLLGDLEYVIRNSPEPANSLRDGLDAAIQLRYMMIRIFDWDEDIDSKV